MTPQSIPVVPSQPNVLDYGIQALYLFPPDLIFNSAEAYAAKFGVAPPPPDYTRMQKGWFNSDPALLAMDPEDDAPTYLYAKPPTTPGGPWTIGSRTLTVRETMTVNLDTGGATTDPAVTAWRGKAREIPIRPLIAGAPNAETLKPLFMGLMVERADLAAQPQAGGFTSTDRAMLTAIYQAMQKAGML